VFSDGNDFTYTAVNWTRLINTEKHAENARLEYSGIIGTKLQGWKMQDWKIREREKYGTPRVA